MKLINLLIISFFLFSGCNNAEKNIEEENLFATAEPDFYLPEDLEIKLWAESPQLFNPTNIDVDIKGRIWVTEAVNYRSFNNDPEKRLHHEKGDRVVILQDTNGDGIADSSKVFVQDEDLVAPLGIAVMGNKIIVSCAPSIIIYTDEDGDDIPDHKEVFLKGFGGFDHDHSLHSVVAGPDGNWYFNTGNAGPHKVTDKAGWTLRSGSFYTGGTPYNKENQGGMKSDDGKIWVGGLALKVGQDGKGLKVLAHNFRNAYELALDSYGNMWQNDNDDEVVACRTSWVMEGGNMGFFNQDGTRSWRADRRPGQDVFTAHWHQEDPGVIPVGDKTGSGSPTGVVVNESDALGAQYRGMLLSADAGRNVIFGYKPQIKGAGYELNREDFISSVKESTEEYVWNREESDQRKWFRPSDVAIGADGAIYIADWFDPIVGGHAMKDTTGYGRIYRITPKGKNLKTTEINLESMEGQIQAFLSPAINVRILGFEKLMARGKEVIPELKKILNSENPYHQARAIWLLSKLGEEGISETKALLDHANQDLRITAFRALKHGPDLLNYAKKASQDPSPAVRREAAIALRDVSFERSKDIIMDLAEKHDGKDRYYLEALGIAMQGKEEKIYPLLVNKFGPEDPLKWDGRMADLAWRLHPPAAIDALKSRANATQLSNEERNKALVALSFNVNNKAVDAMESLAHNTSGEVGETATWLFNYRKTNDWYALRKWEETENVPQNLPEMLALQKKLTDKNSTHQVQMAAVRELALDDMGTLILIRLNEENKLTQAVLDSLDQDFFKNSSQLSQTLAMHYFSLADKNDSRPIQVANSEPIAERGKRAFLANCAFCHTTGNIGGTIGPELTYINRKLDKEFLRKAIVEPNSEVQHGFQPWIITEKNGNVHCGFILSEGNMVLLKRTNGMLYSLHTKNIVSKIQLRDISIMPDPTILGLTERDLADVTEYLMSFRAD